MKMVYCLCHLSPDPIRYGKAIMCHDFKHGQIKEKLYYTDFYKTYGEICKIIKIDVINCFLGQFTTKSVLRYDK